MSRSRIWHNHILIITVIIHYTLYTSPRVLNIIEIPPQVAIVDDGREIRLHPRVDLIYWPTTRIYHRPAGPVEMEAEFGVSPIHFRGMSVASVEFHVVHVPRSERLGVELQVPQHAGVAGARVIPEVFVYPEFQSFGMYLNYFYYKDTDLF